MKLKSFGMLAACALVVTACGGNKGAGDFKNVELTKESSAADSISYLMGNMMGIQTQQITQNDSTINKDDFNEGFYAGLGMVKPDNMSYNQGLMMGLQAAGQLADMSQNMGIPTSTDALASGYKKGLSEKVGEQTVMEIQQKYSAANANAMAEAAAKIVDGYAKGKDYKKQGSTYYKVKTAGTGTKLATGKQTSVKMRLFDTKGKEIMPGSGDQASPVVIGQAPMPMLNTVLPLVNEGSTIEILTTGAEVFGGRTPQGVNPKDVYVVSVEVVPYEPEPLAVPAPEAVQAAPAQAAPAQATPVQ